MGLRERLKKKITMTVLVRQCTIIVTMLSTILLFSIWPRFRNDAMSLPWLVYVTLIFIFSIPFFIRLSEDDE